VSLNDPFNDSFMCVSWLNCAPCLIHVCDMTQLYSRCKSRHTDEWDMGHSHVTQTTQDVTLTFVWCDLFSCVTWLTLCVHLIHNSKQARGTLHVPQTLGLPQTSRANPVQCYRTHQENGVHLIHHSKKGLYTTARSRKDETRNVRSSKS